MSTVSSRGHDAFELNWLNAENQTQVEFCISLDHAQTRADEIEELGGSGIAFHYHMVATIEESPSKAFQPGRRFGHKTFDSNTLKQLTGRDIDDFRTAALQEFDKYMVRECGVTPIVQCDEPGCSANAIEHLHYDFPVHKEIVTTGGITVPFGGEKSGNFCDPHLAPRKAAAHIPSKLGLCEDARCQK